MLRLLNKYTADVDNRSLQQILIRAANYNWKCTYIRGKHNRVADALSRLCKSMCSYSYSYEKNIPRLMTLSTRRALRAKQVEKEDPLVLQIGEHGSEDAEYVDMMNCLETEDYNFAPDELKNISKYKTDLSVINLENGRGIIVRNGCEISIPKPIHKTMLSTLHFTHYSWETMLKQAQGRIFWPGLRNDLKAKNENGPECQRIKNSKAQAPNEVSQKNMFHNFLPGQHVQVDFAIKGQQNYMSMI